MTTRPTPRTRRLATACALAALSALGGCVVAPAPAPGYGDPYGYPSATDVYAPVAPPAPYVEVQPAIPYPGAVWINGYWNWSGNRHAWVPGRYERPRPGWRWQPRRWERAPRGGWHSQGGGWVR